MKNKIIIFALIIGIISCNKTSKEIDKTPLTETQKATKLEKLKIDFNQPVLIDSSNYVMYPLSLNIYDNVERTEYGSFGSSKNSPSGFWNIVFYNTVNGEYHLLDERKMLIDSYNLLKSGNSSSFNESFENKQVNNFLFYTIITLDFNKDGKIDYSDPNYLFLSDKSGKNFKQISPDNCNVTSWDVVKGANKILIQVKKDINNDKVFDEKDSTFPLVYDLAKNDLSNEIFKEDFMNKLKKQLDEQWIPKEK